MLGLRHLAAFLSLLPSGRALRRRGSCRYPIPRRRRGGECGLSGCLRWLVPRRPATGLSSARVSRAPASLSCSPGVLPDLPHSAWTSLSRSLPWARRSLVSFGQPVARDGIPGARHGAVATVVPSLARSAAPGHAVARALAPLSPPDRLGRGQTHERRSALEPTHRPRLSLLDATHPAADRVHLRSLPGDVSEDLDLGHVLHRRRGAVLPSSARVARLLALGAIVFLQLLILLTGNYGSSTS